MACDVSPVAMFLLITKRHIIYCDLLTQLSWWGRILRKNCLYYSIWLDSAQMACIQALTDITSGRKYFNFILGIVSSLYFSNKDHQTIKLSKSSRTSGGVGTLCHIKIVAWETCPVWFVSAAFSWIGTVLMYCVSCGIGMGEISKSGCLHCAHVCKELLMEPTTLMFKVNGGKAIPDYQLDVFPWWRINPTWVNAL